MFKRRVFIKSFSDGEVTQVNNDSSATRLENFIANENSTYFREGFKLLFPIYNREKAKIIGFSDNQFIELTSNSIRIIKNNKLKIKEELKVKESIYNTIVTEKEHNLNEKDEIYLVAKYPQNLTNIDFIYKAEGILSKISLKVSGRTYIPNEISYIKVIKRIETNQNWDTEDIKYTIIDEKIIFINKKDETSRAIYHYDDDKQTFEKKILTDLPNDFYPKSIGVYENRLILAENNKIFFSRSDAPFNFQTNTASNLSAMMYEFNFGKREKIHFCYPSLTTLIIGTNLNIYVAISSEGFLAPGKVIFKRVSSFGSEDVMPTSFGDDLIYIEKGGGFIRLLTYLEKDESL